jgi:transcriptional regulator with XRE-family HTH domain
MIRRSLTASADGIQRAKRALKRKSLTQKAIAIELGIASRSTVSNFFNGHPVDRLIFQEICTALDLEWSTVVEAPDLGDEAEPLSGDDEGDGGDEAVERDRVGAAQDEAETLRQAVREQAAIARDALTPRILERIPREVVRQKYLPAIARGVKDKKPRIIPILGPAGYGKSTILGDLYDELMAGSDTSEPTPWVGLILCSSLSLSRGYFAFTSYSMVMSTMAPVGGVRPSQPIGVQMEVLSASMGENLCGQSRPIEAITADLATLGRGALLIDTLDLIVNREIVQALNRIFREVLANGVTVVFTCRDREYTDYLQPSRIRLPGLSHALDSYSVPNFSTAEIRLAAETFFRQHDPTLASQGATFADNILSLSADNRSLQDIIENPLLLALLCDLFAAEGNVPPDLTVSKLYQRYWQEKVTQTRVDRPDAQRLALEKERLCLAIAQRLFELSGERLCESLYRDELNLELTDIVLDAYQDLLSEGVLALLPSGRLHFFHQTLLEYAIAYYLTRHSAQPQRQQLFTDLNQSEASQRRTYWLPILRQLLTIVDTETEFDTWVSQLNDQDLGIFSIICVAATSRDSPDVLRQLLPTALDLGEAYQKPLRQAFTVASRQLISELWDDLLQLLETGPHTTAGNTAQIIGEIAARWWLSFRDRLIDAVAAIANRSTQSQASDDVREGEVPLMMGWLLQHCFEPLEADGDPARLIKLHSYLPHYGAITYASVIRLHTVVDVPMEVQWTLFKALMNHPVMDDDRVGRAMADWLAYLLGQANVTLLNPVISPSMPLDYDTQTQAWTRTPLGLSWIELLHHPLPDRWDKVQGNGIGRWASNDSSRLAPLVFDLMYGPRDRLNQTLHSLKISVQNGASSLILTCLQSNAFQQDSMAVQNVHALGQLLSRCVPHLLPDQQETLVQWLSPLLDSYIEQLHIAMDALADQSKTARTLLRHHLPNCSPAKQQLLSYRLLRFQPIQTHPPLDTLDKAAQTFLIRLYRQQAQSQHPDLPKLELDQRLLQAAHGPMKDIAVAATHEMAVIFGDRLTFSQIMPLMRSPYHGVRTNALSATIEYLKQDKLPTVEEMDECCAALQHERDPNAIRLLFNVINLWARKHQPISPVIFQALSDLPPRLVEQSKFEGGAARSLLDALKAIAQVSTLFDLAPLLHCTEYLLTHIDVSRMRNGEAETIVLLCAIHRLDSTFLSTFIHQHASDLAHQQWQWTLSALFKTIALVEGKQSDLFDTLLSAEWCTPAISHLIVAIQT